MKFVKIGHVLRMGELARLWSSKIKDESQIATIRFGTRLWVFSILLVGEDQSSTAASGAFALDSVSVADRSHLPVLVDGILVVQVDSPAHIAGMAALVQLEELVDKMVSEAGSRVAADLVR